MYNSPSPTFWDDERLSLDRALEIVSATISRYGSRYPHWQCSFSGGKDSSALMVVLFWLWREGRIPKPESLTVLYADTRLELPPLKITALKMMDAIQAFDLGFPIHTQVVEPPMQDRFYVRMLGLGYPPPHSGLRYCTDLLKKKPMEQALMDNAARYGGKVLNMTGYRKGESVVRDQRIATACSSKDGECGQGALLASAQKDAEKSGMKRGGLDTIDWMFLRTPETHPADYLAPILHFRICTIADVLGLFGPDLGMPTQDVLAIYGAGSGDQESVACRTGCICCPVAGHEDYALTNIVKHMPDWHYLAPLLQLRQLYVSLESPAGRLRKSGERNKDGRLSSRPNRLGPLTPETRRRGLAEVLRIQDETNTLARAQGRPQIVLIDDEERRHIESMIDAGRWPRKWGADDLPGGVLTDLYVADTDHGTLVQPVLCGLREVT